MTESVNPTQASEEAAAKEAAREARRAAMRAARERRSFRLREATMLSPTVRALTFEVVKGAPVVFAPGQYVNVYIPQDGDDKRPLQRSYSLSHAAPGQLRLAVTHVDGGPGSTFLHAMAEGDVIEGDGPWGLFTLERVDEAAPLLFVGTGTGVVPLRAMIEAELASGRERPVTLIFGTRTISDRLWADELQQWSEAHPRFSVITTLSQGEDDWQGPRGYVQEHLRAALAPFADKGTPQVLICGLKAMIDGVRAVLKDDFGFDRKQIHTERYD